MDVTGGWVSIHCHITVAAPFALYPPTSSFSPLPPDMLRSKRSLIDFHRRLQNRRRGSARLLLLLQLLLFPLSPLFGEEHFAGVTLHGTRSMMAELLAGGSVRSVVVVVVVAHPTNERTEGRTEEPFDPSSTSSPLIALG